MTSYCTHFSHEKTEFWRGQMLCLGAHSGPVLTVWTRASGTGHAVLNVLVCVCHPGQLKAPSSLSKAPCWILNHMV